MKARGDIVTLHRLKPMSGVSTLGGMVRAAHAGGVPRDLKEELYRLVVVSI